MLALRTTVCNDRWDEVWHHRSKTVQQHKQQQRQARTQQRVKAAQRQLLGFLVQRQAVAPAPPPLLGKTTLATVSEGSGASHPKRLVRPAATHPWRRRLLPLQPMS